ncbi:MAG: hypothetical protein PHX74_11820 [Candidatus Sumerlaeales bacterium]|nr:hypothetical protein [Candidatus Sumerlaeales bacterium]
MGLKVGCFATIWQVEPKGKYTKVRFSTSKKNKDTNAYETDFSGFANFVGQANVEAAKLKERDRVKVEEFEVTTKYDAEKKVTYTNYSVFKISNPNAESAQPATQASKAPDTAVEGDADELPF